MVIYVYKICTYIEKKERKKERERERERKKRKRRGALALEECQMLIGKCEGNCGIIVI